jgi:hypothetical protein
MHVYVCRVVNPDKTLAPSLHADDLSIEYWATVSPIASQPSE